MTYLPIIFESAGKVQPSLTEKYILRYWFFLKIVLNKNNSVNTREKAQRTHPLFALFGISSLTKKSTWGPGPVSPCDVSYLAGRPELKN